MKMIALAPHPSPAPARTEALLDEALGEMKRIRLGQQLLTNESLSQDDAERA